MSNKFDCLITGGTRNGRGRAVEFTFQFVNATEESRFLDLHGTALGYHELACTVIVGESPHSAEAARLEAQNAELLEALKRVLPQYEALLNDCGLAGSGLIIDALKQARAAIAKAEGEGL